MPSVPQPVVGKSGGAGMVADLLVAVNPALLAQECSGECDGDTGTPGLGITGFAGLAKTAAICSLL